jgi:branched-chain amino acid transport system substrate-binding protein
VKAALAVLVVLVSCLAAGCGGDDHTVTASSCGRVLYEGEGAPDVVVVSELPLRTFLAPETRPMVDAIELVLRRRGFRAGAYRVGYQSCNDAVGQEPYDESLCRQNAHAYVEAEKVVGIIGPHNSGCAFEQIPIVGRRSAGPLAMVSPSTTWPGLTRKTTQKRSGAALYPEGIRNFVRVVTHDEAQGIAAARRAKQLGARHAVVVVVGLPDDPYPVGLKVSFLGAASRLGLTVRAFSWDTKQSSRRLTAEVAATRPDAVYIAGYPVKRLVEDLRSAVGAETPIIGPDGFAFSHVLRELGRAGEGIYVTFPGIPRDRLPPAGRELMRTLGLAPAVDTTSWAPEAAQAADILLDAIARSDGTRASVADELHETRVRHGILGSFSFDADGDIVPALVGVYRIRGGNLVTERVLRVRVDPPGK